MSYIFFLFPLGLWAQKVDSSLIVSHLHHIVDDFPNRNERNLKSLDNCASYIFSVFEKYGDSTCFQSFGKTNEYKNVITSFGPKNGERIIIGAHYDVCGEQNGADDNASGVVGLLEIARLLQHTTLTKRIDLVAYTLEEPPHFRTEMMGSFVHADYLQSNNVKVYGMICLEMIGYFSDEKGSQNYPLKVLKLFYGSKGDYITFVQKSKGGKMVKEYKKSFKKHQQLKTKFFKGPANLQGIDFSDHLNYWKFGYPAVMITNTGFFRNKNYHTKNDKINTLDIDRMCKVVQQVYESVLELANP